MKGRRLDDNDRKLTSKENLRLLRYPDRVIATHKKLLWIDQNFPDLKMSYRDIKNVKYNENDTGSLGRLFSYMDILRSLGVIDFERNRPLHKTYKLIYKGDIEQLLRQMYAREDFLAFVIQDELAPRVAPSDATTVYRCVHRHLQDDGTTVLSCRIGGDRKHYVVGGWNGDEILNNERYWEKNYWVTDEIYGEYLKRRKTEKQSDSAL